MFDEPHRLAEADAAAYGNEGAEIARQLAGSQLDARRAGKGRLHVSCFSRNHTQPSVR